VKNLDGDLYMSRWRKKNRISAIFTYQPSREKVSDYLPSNILASAALKLANFNEELLFAGG